MQRKRTELEWAVHYLTAYLYTPFGLPHFASDCVNNLAERLRTLRRIQSIEAWKREGR